MHFLSQFGSNSICVLFRMGRQLLTELLVLDIVFLQRRIHRSRIVHLNPAFDHVLFQTGVIGFLRNQADAMFVLPRSRMIPSCLWRCEHVVAVRTVSRNALTRCSSTWTSITLAQIRKGRASQIGNPIRSPRLFLPSVRVLGMLPRFHNCEGEEKTLHAHYGSRKIALSL